MYNENENENINESINKRPKRTYTSKAIVYTVLITFAVTSFLSYGFFSLKAAAVRNIPLLSSMTAQDHKDVSNEVYSYLKSTYLYDIDDEKLDYGAAKGMVEALGDPYTRYLPPDDFAEYLNDGAGNYIGVGIIFTLNDKNEIMVAGTYPGSPGEKAQIKSGDILLSVDSKPCSKDNYEEIVSYIRGEQIDLSQREGSSFDIEYQRKNEDGTEEKHSATLTRQTIHVNSITSKMLDENIGYIAVSSFTNTANEEFFAACDELLSKGMKDLIIDLRDNGGGDFNVAIDMAGAFLPDKSLVVYTVDKNQKKKEYFSDKQKYSVKPVILVNGNSASASEVFTAALKDNNAARAIVGTKTYGKGITQNVYQMRSGGGLVVTVDTYYTPNGTSIHKTGITPTDEVQIAQPYDKYPASYYTDEIDTQKQKAIEILKH